MPPDEPVISEWDGQTWEIEVTIGKYLCPVDGCRKTYTTVYGVRSHYWHVHGDASDTGVCETCGEEFERRPSNPDQKYCDKECRYKE